MSDVRANSGVPVLAQFVGTETPSACAPLVVDSATGKIYSWKTGDVIVAAGALGTVTSVATGTGLSGGPITTTGTISIASTITAGGPTGSATVSPIITYNAQGQLTTVSSATITPAVGNVTGLGTGVATALAVNIGTAGSPVVNGGALGSPSSAGTIPAFTLGGTIAGGGNQLNNIIIGTSTPLAGAFTTAQSTTPVNSLTAGVSQFKSGSWTPSPTSLTVVGTPAYTGTYTRTDDRVTVTLLVTSSTSTASTFGTTFWTGLPYTVAEYSPMPCIDVNQVQTPFDGQFYQNNRIYTPTWTASNNMACVGTYRTTDSF